LYQAACADGTLANRKEVGAGQMGGRGKMGGKHPNGATMLAQNGGGLDAPKTHLLREGAVGGKKGIEQHIRNKYPFFEAEGPGANRRIVGPHQLKGLEEVCVKAMLDNNLQTTKFGIVYLNVAVGGPAYSARLMQNLE
jgi:hypothetical protein